MEILIDRQNIDFELENEKNLFDVIQSLEKWLVCHSRLIKAVTVDGSIIGNFYATSLQFQLLPSFAKLELSTASKYEFGIELLMELREYMNSMLESVMSLYVDFKDLETKNHLLEGLHWIHTVIKQLLSSFHIDAETVFDKVVSLNDVVAQLDSLEVDLRENIANDRVFQAILSERLEGFLHILSPFLLKISHRVLFICAKESGAIDKDILKVNIEDILESLEESFTLIKRINIHLQTNCEVEAYLDIKNILGILANVVMQLEIFKEALNISYKDWVVDGKFVEKENEELNILIEKLYKVFVQKDSLLLDNFLEHELLDRFERYKRIFQECIVMVAEKTYN